MNAIIAKPCSESGIPERRLYSIKELCQLTHMSHATAWRRISEFDIRRIGRRAFVTAESIERFLDSLPRR
jgi:predicted DNA-binding transcriptional regulator AlpA